MQVSWNMGTPKSPNVIGFSSINHPAIGVPPWLWKTHCHPLLTIIHHILTIHFGVPPDGNMPGGLWTSTRLGRWSSQEGPSIFSIFCAIGVATLVQKWLNKTMKKHHDPGNINENDRDTHEDYQNPLVFYGFWWILVHFPQCSCNLWALTLFSDTAIYWNDFMWKIVDPAYDAPWFAYPNVLRRPHPAFTTRRPHLGWSWHQQPLAHSQKLQSDQRVCLDMSCNIVDFLELSLMVSSILEVAWLRQIHCFSWCYSHCQVMQNDAKFCGWASICRGRNHLSI